MSFETFLPFFKASPFEKKKELLEMLRKELFYQEIDININTEGSLLTFYENLQDIKVVNKYITHQKFKNPDNNMVKCHIQGAWKIFDDKVTDITKNKIIEFLISTCSMEQRFSDVLFPGLFRIAIEKKYPEIALKIIQQKLNKSIYLKQVNPGDLLLVLCRGYFDVYEKLVVINKSSFSFLKYDKYELENGLYQGNVKELKHLLSYLNINHKLRKKKDIVSLIIDNLGNF